MPVLAKQLDFLGTETAFAVSAMAAEWRARGNRVFPFHLGDINILPPAAMRDGVARAMAAGHNGYCPGAGIPQLRSELAAHFGERRGARYDAANVAVQPGGKPVIAKFLQAVMNPGERVLSPVPGFPIYESQILYQGGVAAPYCYVPDGRGGFALDLAAIEAAAKGARAIIFNNYHNPTCHCASAAEVDEVARIAVENDLWILNDDAYFEIRYDGAPAQSILTRPGVMERTINLFTFSKQYAMTGWRIGAAIGPAEAIAAISTMNTNMESCTSHFTQVAMAEALASGRDDISPVVAELRERRDAIFAALDGIDGVVVARPSSGFYVYCDVGAIVRRKGLGSVDALMRETLRATGVSFCTGEHFGEDAGTTYARFAYSGIGVADIEAGGSALKRYFEGE